MLSNNWFAWFQHAPWIGDCVLCHQPASTTPLLCAHCAGALNYLATPCPRCGYPLPSGSSTVCGRCLTRPPRWNMMRVVADYSAEWQFLMQQFKYHHQPELAALLARLFYQHIAVSTLPEVLLPVPMHPWRYWRRGYNQAQLLAGELGKHYQIPVDTSRLHRIKATSPQVGLSRSQRKRNLRQAFTLTAMPWQHVAVVDDVVTTGSTAEALCKLLLAAGVHQVEIWAICHTQER